MVRIKDYFSSSFPSTVSIYCIIFLASNARLIYDSHLFELKNINIFYERGIGGR
jgi:hypothetical protein